MHLQAAVWSNEPVPGSVLVNRPLLLTFYPGVSKHKNNVLQFRIGINDNVQLNEY